MAQGEMINEWKHFTTHRAGMQYLNYVREGWVYVVLTEEGFPNIALV